MLRLPEPTEAPSLNDPILVSLVDGAELSAVRCDRLRPVL